MKAVQEIIDYLFRRDLLSTDDLRRLDADGLLAGTLAGELLADEAESKSEADREIDRFDQLSERERMLDLAEADFDRAPSRRRRSSGRKPTTHPVAREVVSDRILNCLAEDAERLRGLQKLASAIGPAIDLATALKTLLATSEAGLQRAIAAVLAQPANVFLDVWDAATFRWHRFLLKSGEHGPTAVAYQALLKGAGPSDLGRYASELAAPGLVELMRLVKAQRRVLGAIGALLTASPATFDRPLFLRANDQICYWALTVAITAVQNDIAPSAAIPLGEPIDPYFKHADFELEVFEHALAVTRRTLDALAHWQDQRTALRCPPVWNLRSPPVWHLGSGTAR